MNRKRKIITIRITDDIDVTRVLPIIETPEFQRLGFKKQLGASSLVFRSANHTRLEHSLGVFARTQERAKLWVEMGMIEPDEAWDLAIFGLLHDIGHGPYSHVIESLLSVDHDAKGLEIIERLHSAIDECSADFQRVRAMFERKHPLWQAVMHHPLGTDKLDYLDRDASQTNHVGRPAIGQIMHFTYFIDNQLVVDVRMIHELMRLQSFYAYMYDRVYLRKLSLIIQRFMQKMVAELMFPASGKEPELTEERFWELVDNELDYLIANSKNPMVQRMYQRFLTRQFPKVAVSLRIGRFAEEERNELKPIAAFGISEEEMSRFRDLESPRALKAAEEAIAKIADIPAEAVVVVPVSGAARFIPTDISVVLDLQSSKIDSLRKMRPKHFEALEEIARSYAAIRVSVFEEYRKKIAEPTTAKKVFDYLMDTTRHPMS